jgi:hypothetical protein
MTQQGSQSLEDDPAELRRILDYDPMTGEFIWREKVGRAVVVGRKAGMSSSRTGCYLRLQVGGVAYLSHRLAFVWMTGRKPVVVDHINGNVSDNRWANLREATTRENAQNCRRAANNTTGVKNVSYEAKCRGRKKYRVAFRVDGRVRNFGSYLTLDEAAAQAKAVRASLHGDFGREA